MNEKAIDEILITGVIILGLGLVALVVWLMIIVGSLYGLWAIALLLILFGAGVMSLGFYLADRKEKTSRKTLNKL